MSSGFVKEGAPAERDAAWLQAEAELEETRRRKAEQARQADGKGLYEALQANRAAKEEAFAEAAKLKNQFRSLDQDEIEFLDSVMESTRAEESRVKKETMEGLAAFRKQQEELEKKAREDTGDVAVIEEDNWAAGTQRKRKRIKEKEGLKGVKLRKSSTTDDTAVATTEAVTEVRTQPAKLDQPSEEAASTAKNTPPAAPPTKSGLGLVSYGSDTDDD